MGLIVGAVALVLNSCVSLLFGFCGSMPMALVIGGVAGFLAAHQEKPATRMDGVQAGAVAGGIAGAFNMVGQVIGRLAQLLIAPELFRALGMDYPSGQLPNPGNAAQVSMYWISDLGVGVCFGLVGIVLAASAGAAIAYFVTSSEVSTPTVG